MEGASLKPIQWSLVVEQWFECNQIHERKVERKNEHFLSSNALINDDYYILISDLKTFAKNIK